MSPTSYRAALPRMDSVRRNVLVVYIIGFETLGAAGYLWLMLYLLGGRR